MNIDEAEENTDSEERKTDLSGENKDQKTLEVPKLGESEKRIYLFSLWWLWLIIGMIIGASVHKIFLSVVKFKKKGISD